MCVIGKRKEKGVQKAAVAGIEPPTFQLRVTLKWENQIIKLEAATVHGITGLLSLIMKKRGRSPGGVVRKCACEMCVVPRSGVECDEVDWCASVLDTHATPHPCNQ